MGGAWDHLSLRRVEPEVGGAKSRRGPETEGSRGDWGGGPTPTLRGRDPFPACAALMRLTRAFLLSYSAVAGTLPRSNGVLTKRGCGVFSAGS